MTEKAQKAGSSGLGSLPRLLMSRIEVDNQITAQIEKGRQLSARPIQSEKDLEVSRAQYKQWDDYNTVMLRRQFDSSEVADEYGATFGGFVTVMPSLETEVRGHLRDVERKVTILESVRGRLSLYEEVSPSIVSTQSEARSRDIFVVHGHDAEATQSVARFIEILDLRAVILHEQPSGGRTVIEKFEEESLGVGYAVVLLTPDDIGAPGDKPEETKRRARQNVVFELGFFVGRLGRARVCVLHKGVVDIPSDFQGVIYVAMDEAGAWQIALAREMKEAGIDLDMNKVL